jgi:putative tryptophan/tyrosine transport system substrate-binding protein
MRIGRRAFISALGAVMAPRLAVAQQSLPVIGLLHEGTIESYIANAPGLAMGLKDAGYIEAQNLAIEYRFANGEADQLSMLAAELVRGEVAMIVAGGPRAALAAKAASTTIPIVFVLGIDPLELGLVTDLNRPDGNITGVSFVTTGLAAQKLMLLRELVPQAKSVAYLVEGENVLEPLSRAIEGHISEMMAAAAAIGWQVVVAKIGRDRNYDAAFATFTQRHASVLVVAPSEIFASNDEDITAAAARSELPAVYPSRLYVAGAGLMSYGARQPDAWQLAGAYAARILKGSKPADLPVTRSNKVELVVSRLIAQSLDLSLPPALIARADAVLD